MVKHSSPEQIVVRGAREHNLKGVDLSFPRDSLVTFTGVSGSGKSSLAYHTIYQEGQRRFLESLSSYARQFLGKMEKPKVDHIEGLSPTVSIDQKSVGSSPRSTVGTLTEVLDYLRLFMARLGTPTCPTCGAVIDAWSVDQIVEAILSRYAGAALLVMAPVVRDRKGEYRKELADFRQKGFVRARIDGEVRRLDEDIALHRYKYHTIELILDRLRVAEDIASRLAEAVEQALSLSSGLVAVVTKDGADYELFSTSRACPEGHGAVPEMEPRLFSFNSPVGACQECDGLGEVHSFSEKLLVRDPMLSLRDGAIAAFTAEGKLAYGRITLDHMGKIAADHGFAIDTPWKELTAAQQKVVMRGSGKKKYEFDWKKKGQNYSASGVETKAWPGVVPHLKKVYRNATARHLDRFRAATVCDSCDGSRLNQNANAVTFDGRNLPDWVRWSVAEAADYFANLKLQGNAAAIGKEILIAIETRLRFLLEVGLGYLTIDRRASTLSGGESQRIRLAAQVGSGLRGILYVLDEPSIGLHSRDQQRLLGTLANLRDRGNTVCVVEHDEATMAQSDWLVDVGPGAGVHGGELVFSGVPSEIERAKGSLTAQYLRGELSIPVPQTRRPGNGSVLTVRGARHHNLRDLTVEFPLGCLIAVTGVSGSGKSTLINHIMKKALRRDLNRADDVPGDYDEIVGMEHLDKVIEISQSPIGRTPRSNPATYTSVWDHVRDLFAKLPESRMRAYPKGRFSFNVAGGRCEACDGAGVLILEMQFLSPVEVVCEDCNGKRFNPETLEIVFKEKNVSDYLEMSVDEAYEYFQAIPKIERGLQALRDVGLGYVRLGQTSTTLSGGEAQRVKLATELQRPATGRTIYLLDEPTTGLHFDDIRKLLVCVHRLVDAGNSVVVIEHNLDVVKSADHVIDLGPEGGDGGGKIVFVGSPEALCKVKGSHTAAALRPVLFPKKTKCRTKAAKKPTRRRPDDKIRVVGASKNNLKSIDVDLPIGKFSVITGVSGSGKSSLAFDTLFGEGQRRFIESLSTYARRFLGRMDRAPVDRLEGLGPAIAIDQKASHRSPRSTVATATEIHDYLRLLYARVGRPHCPEHGQELVLHSPSSIARVLLDEFAGRRGYILSPVSVPSEVCSPRDKLKKFIEGLRESWKKDGFVRAMLDGVELRLDDPLPLGKGKGYVPELYLVVDRVTFKDRGRLVDSADLAGRMGQGRLVVRAMRGKSNDNFEERIFTTDRSCALCGHGVPTNPHPRYFSFNHHSGACEYCSGLGQINACDPELLVNHPDRPTFHGAIQHQGGAFTFLTKKTGWYVKIAKQVAKKHGFDLNDNFEDLSEEAQEILLYGTGEERHEVTHRRGGASRRTFKMAVQWKGFCTQIEEWVTSGGSSERTKDNMRAVMAIGPCAECGGDRLAAAQRNIFVGGRSLSRFTQLSVDDAIAALGRLRLRKAERVIADEILLEISNRLQFLSNVGLGYLTLDRSARTLSGGEAQRIRLASQLGNRLVGVLYVLDEPTVGLHPRDTAQLLTTLMDLRDLGNTVVTVEHDEAVMRAADYIVDMGPGAGHQGGRVVAAGTPLQVAKSKGLTGQYLRGKLSIPVPKTRRESVAAVRLKKLSQNNLKNVDVAFPLGVMTAVTGVSGSGKSTLVLESLLPALAKGAVLPKGFKDAQMIVVDQSPIGSTPASNPATYTGLFTPMRELFAEMPVSKVKGFGPGRFSFNMKGGRCEACEGKGQIRVEMHFLADVWVTCDVCRGKRYNAETLGVELRGKHMADVLDMEVAVALDFFGNHPRIRRPLQAMVDVGLGYLRLGQPGNTLSGGESQRIKLVAQLARPARRHHVYLLDEPTTGLHLQDVARLIEVLRRLVDQQHTVIVIEHHLDVIKNADHVIELGPGAGPLGGEIVIAGTPEQVAKTKKSETGKWLQV
jgi:excinuclease ABC subunit A